MRSQLTEIEEARGLILERARPLPAESVPIADAVGRVLAEPITSADDVPAFDNSAMDGFAVRAGDLAGASAEAPVRLPVGAESRAGHPAGGALEAGEAFAISTGAMLPAGADAVVRVEDTDGGEDPVEIRVAPHAGANVRRAGEDIRAGETAIAAGTQIGAAEAGVLASVGRAHASCTRRPLVNVLTTGDELREPGEELEPGTVRNSNAHTLAALIPAAGAELGMVEIVRDDAASTRLAFDRGLAGDVLVISGGVSVGEHDHVRPALERLGVEQVFWGIALRPGKPTYFGLGPERAGRRTLVFGLPGNPVSVFVTFLLFARPAIRALLGARDPDPRRTTAILDERYEKQPGRAHLIRCTLELRDDGWHARPTKQQGSHVLSSMLGAEALAIIPTATASIGAGERVEIELLPA